MSDTQASPLSPITSAFTPSGPVAQMIADISWMMTAVFTGVFVIVMALLFYGLKASRKDTQPSPPLGDKVFIIVGGILIPALILIVVLVRTLIVTDRLEVPENALTIRVTGHMWWWDVYYPESNIRSANELYIPVGKPVRIELFSNDVIHSLWVPSLSGKTDLLPGIQNVHWLQADKPGTYRGQCAEFCGTQHTWMALYVVALPEKEYDDWIRERQEAMTLLPSTLPSRGFQLFESNGCATCHTIHSTPANGNVGPDLTHIGSRVSLGAGKIPNNFGNLSGWIANPQAIKPGNKMPATKMKPKDLHELTAYLMSLK